MTITTSNSTRLKPRDLRGLNMIAPPLLDPPPQYPDDRHQRELRLGQIHVAVGPIRRRMRVPGLGFIILPVPRFALPLATNLLAPNFQLLTPVHYTTPSLRSCRRQKAASAAAAIARAASTRISVRQIPATRSSTPKCNCWKMCSESVITPGGSTRMVAANSPKATAKAASQATNTAGQRSGSTMRNIRRSDPAPSTAAASNNAGGTVRRACHSTSTAAGSPRTVSASQGARVVWS